jgi:hypothetical protein
MRRLLLLVALLPTAALADPRTDCPTPAPCKVLVLTVEEEKALVGSNMVFDTAAQGRQIELSGLAFYFRDKIARAPAGDAPKPAMVVPNPDDPKTSGVK